MKRNLKYILLYIYIINTQSDLTKYRRFLIRVSNSLFHDFYKLYVYNKDLEAFVYAHFRIRFQRHQYNYDNSVSLQ